MRITFLNDMGCLAKSSSCSFVFLVPLKTTPSGDVVRTVFVTEMTGTTKENTPVARVSSRRAPIKLVKMSFDFIFVGCLAAVSQPQKICVIPVPNRNKAIKEPLKKISPFVCLLWATIVWVTNVTTTQEGLRRC